MLGEPSAPYSQWRASLDYQAQVRNPYNAIFNTAFCDMNTYGEVRALIGGVTSILATPAQPCIRAWFEISTSAAVSAVRRG